MQAAQRVASAQCYAVVSDTCAEDNALRPAWAPPGLSMISNTNLQAPSGVRQRINSTLHNASIYLSSQKTPKHFAEPASSGSIAPMTESTSRRNFLRGKFSARKGPLRPPWALTEDDFLNTCTRCGDCVRACPTHIIIDRDAGYPTIDFGEGECTFCGDCVSACTAGALRRKTDQMPWLARASINKDCLARQGVECRICGDLCAGGIIRFPPLAGGIALPLLDQACCTGCGACVTTCPTRAIAVAVT